MPLDPEQLAEARRRLEDGEPLESVVLDLSPTGEAADVHADRVRLAAIAAGLSSGAWLAFLLGAPALLRPCLPLPPEQAIERAAVFGLIVGLTARQLADGE